MRTGEFWARVPLAVVQNLDMDCVLGTSFSDQDATANLLGTGRAAIYPFFIATTTGQRSLDKADKSLLNE